MTKRKEKREKFKLQVVTRLYKEEKNVTCMARRYAQVSKIKYTDTLRRRLNDYVKENNLKKDKGSKTPEDVDVSISETITETVQYKKDKVPAFMPSAWNSEKSEFYKIEGYCDKYNLDINTVKSSKLVSHNAGHMVYNIAFNPTINEQSGIDESFITKVVKEHVKATAPFSFISVSDDNFFDRCVMTDIHLNMDPSGEINTLPMYDHKWGRDEVFKRLNKTIEHIIEFKKGDTLVIDELGDFMDGLQGQTTRGGHHLPQTISDKEAFKLGIDFKMHLIDSLVQVYDKVILNNVTNDNHSFLFGFFVNAAVKNIVDLKYPNKVEYNILEKFLSHYSVGSHTFVISHGKDSGEKKFGFKATYDPKASDVIDAYCKTHGLYNGNFIEFSMGDQHQRIFDSTSSNDFDYNAYGAFSPPSNWVGTNFKDTASSVDMFNIHKTKKLKINYPLIF